MNPLSWQTGAYLAFRQQVKPLVDAGVVQEGQISAILILADLAGEQRFETLLACLLTLAALDRGDVCFDLDQPDSPLQMELRPGYTLEALRALLPQCDAEAWAQKLDSPLCLKLDDRSSLAGASAAALGESLAGVKAQAADEASGQNSLRPCVFASDRPFILEGHRLYRQRSFIEERKICDRLQKLAAPIDFDRSIVADHEALNRGLDAIFGADPANPGRLAVRSSFDSRLTVLTGGPGTGKTWTVRNLIALHFVQRELARRMNPALPPLSVALAAPTGKAAMRMVESLQSKLDLFIAETVPNVLAYLPITPADVQTFLSNLQASTIHRLLGVKRFDPGKFAHDEQNPLCSDLLVIDEASMIDLALMRSLLDAVGNDQHLILLGDPNQLASIEAGNVLGDIVSAQSAQTAIGRRIFKLLVNHRAADCPELAEFSAFCCASGPAGDEGAGRRGAGDSIYNEGAASRDAGRSSRDEGAGRRGAGDSIYNEGAASRDAGGSAFFDGSAARKAVELLKNGRAIHLEPLPVDARSLDDRLLDRIIDAYRIPIDLLRRGPDPDETECHHLRRVFDLFLRFRVLCAHRSGPFGVDGLNASITAKLRALYGLPFNRELIGRPILILQNDPQLELCNGDIGLCVRHDDALKVVFPSARPERPFVWFAPSQLPDHETAFAMTIHKSQGSEFAHSFVILQPKRSPIITRELVYTAATRAKSALTFVADEDLLIEALNTPVLRASGLSQKLRTVRYDENACTNL